MISRRSSTRFPPNGRPLCFPRPSRHASPRSPKSTSRTRCGSASRASPLRREARLALGKWRTSCRGSTSCRRSAAFWTWRVRRRRSCSAARAQKSTSCPRRSLGAATGPRRCMAASLRNNEIASCSASATARPSCSSRRMSRRGASTSNTYRTSSTTTCRRPPTRTCIASAAPAVPDAKASPSLSPNRASTACSATSSSSPSSASPSSRCRR